MILPVTRFRLGTHLFVKVPRPGDSEVTFLIFESLPPVTTMSNHSKVEAIPLSALPKDTTKANLPDYNIRLFGFSFSQYRLQAIH